jgi:RNA polymerase sigma factor (sigma-70 family)
MADGSQDIQTLMDRIRAGSQEAVQELLAHYGPHLVRVIRRRLSQRLRTEFDSDDFVQSVWASFFAVPLEGYHFDTPKALMAFLTDIATNKVADAARERLQTKKRDLNRLHSLDGSAAIPAGAVADHTPTPSQVVVAEDEWYRMLRSQPPYHRVILILLRQGHTHEEVAQQLSISTRTVRRVVQQAQEKLKVRTTQ